MIKQDKVQCTDHNKNKRNQQIKQSQCSNIKWFKKMSLMHQMHIFKPHARAKHKKICQPSTVVATKSSSALWNNNQRFEFESIHNMNALVRMLYHRINLSSCNTDAQCTRSGRLGPLQGRGRAAGIVRQRSDFDWKTWFGRRILPSDARISIFRPNVTSRAQGSALTRNEI